MKDKENISYERIAHDNGLTAKVYFQYDSLELIDNGLYFYLISKYSRQIDAVRLEIVNHGPPDDAERRKVDDTVYEFKLDNFQGGNGAPEYKLSIWKKLGDRWIELNHHVQSEREPNFSKSWKLIESATVKW